MPSVGPRDTRTPLRRTCRGQAWLPTSAELPATIPVWSGADDWLARLQAALESAQGAEARQKAGFSIRTATVLDVAAVDARAANSRTGRDVATAHETVAEELGCSAKTVQRARTLIEALGYAVTVLVGRYLTRAERAQARQTHGHDQRRMASHRALVVSRTQPNVHLPRRGEVCRHVQSRSDLPKRAQARAQAAPRPAPKRDPVPRSAARPPLAIQRLAAQLGQRLPWLLGNHSWALCRTLIALGIDDTGWTAQDVIDLLDRRNTELGLYSLPAHSQHAPLALFAFQMRQALAAVDEPPRIVRERQRALITAQRERARVAQAEYEAQLDAERSQPEIQARVDATKARMRQTLARIREEARWRH